MGVKTLGCNYSSMPYGRALLVKKFIYCSALFVGSRCVSAYDGCNQAISRKHMVILSVSNIMNS